MSKTTDEKREKYLRQVRYFLDIADRETTEPGEAAAARAKAEHLMREYRIAEEETLASDPASMKPEWREFEICERMSEFDQAYLNIFSYVAHHVGVRARYAFSGKAIVASAVGYGFDIRMLDMIFTAARLVFSEHLEPKIDAALSDAENAYRLRRAGIARNRVANMLWGASMDSDGAPAHGKVAKLYKSECERRGETAALSGRAVSADVYRDAYAKSFTTALWNRLYAARDAVDKSSGAITLAGREARVDEAFYERYPERRPTDGAVDRTAKPCDACAKTKSATRKCRIHRPYVETAADRARYRRENLSEAARGGKLAGKSAAEQVKLDGSEPVRRIDDRSAEERETTRVLKGVLEG